MTHRKIALKISAFVDNELSESVKSEVETHFETCRECRDEVKRLKSQAIYMNTQKESEIIPSSAFRAKVNALIDSQLPVKRGWININKLIPLPLAMALVVVVFSIYMMAAPVVYGMNNDAVKTPVSAMVQNALVSCFAGSVFSPIAFAKFCGACTANACGCCGAKCGPNCKMGGENHGN